MRRVVTSWIFAAVCVSSAWAVEPANRKSNPQVKAVLEYFYSLSDKTDNRIVSGQFTNFGNGSNLRIMEQIHESTGQWPALLGADYADFRRGSITTKKLDNLIWVYGPNKGEKTAAYYAGDEYVDMLGLDAYTDFLDPEHIQGYDEIVALNKPFGFSEYGPHGSSNPPGDYDYRRFIEGVKKYFPKTCYFMCWNAKWSLATNQNVKEMLSDPAVANRDELPKELFSKATKPVSVPPVEGNWTLVFEDTFDGDKLDSSKWIPSYEWGQTHNYNAYCDPANVLVEKGLLRLKVEDKPSHGKKYTSAVITSYGKFSQKYGYFEGRFRIPTGKGFWPAFWMLPYPQHWPPEIDIFETIKDDPQIYMTYHWDDQGHKSHGRHWTEDSFSYSKEFHTYGLLWEPDKIVWYIDGIERSRFTDARVIVSEPMYLLINFGIDAGWPGQCDATTPFPSYYECDVIRVYQRN